MMDAKMHEEDASKYDIEPEAGREVADDQLEGVAGGDGSEGTCPNCGSTDYHYDWANHMMICHNCMA